MNYFIAIFIFCVVLFLYLHVYYHLKTSNDLEVYTIDRPSKEKLEEICDLRQPVIFEYHNEQVDQTCNLSQLDDQYGAFDVKLRDVKGDKNEQMFLPFLLKEALKVFQSGDKKYISENNSDFLEETAVIKQLKYSDSFLRPAMVSKCNYDLWIGSEHSMTPLRYHLDYRTFLYITSGKAKLKLIPPKSKKYLSCEKDYDNFEFRSPVNVWDVQPEYQNDFDKIKVLDIDIVPGYIIFIPAYWWYSIQYDELSSICVFRYRTYMNTLAISPQIGMSLLQKQNIKNEIAEKLAIS